MSCEPDMWYAFECFAHSEYMPKGAFVSRTGVVFDVRVTGEDRLEKAKCPVCGAECELRGQWPADEGGYGSGGSPLASTERRHKEMLERFDALLSSVNGLALSLRLK